MINKERSFDIIFVMSKLLFLKFLFIYRDGSCFTSDLSSFKSVT